MEKKYRVWLSAEEREELKAMVSKGRFIVVANGNTTNSIQARYLTCTIAH